MIYLFALYSDLTKLALHNWQSGKKEQTSDTSRKKQIDPPINLTKIIMYLHSRQWYITRLQGYRDTANELDSKLNPGIKF